MLNKLIANILPYFPESFVWLFSKRYIAGKTMEDGLAVSRELNEQGIEVTVDVLGEFITSLEEAKANRDEYFEVIQRFSDEKIKGNFSVKPSMFGLLIDKEICYNYLREIVALAAEKNNFVRIDMEDSKCVDMEIEIFKRLRNEFPTHVGLVLQAYLRRTRTDLEMFETINSATHPLNFRLCKGIYVEPEKIAYKKYQEVRAHYLENLRFMFEHKMYVGIATHDSYLVEEALKMIKELNVPQNMYEFQMLYGVTPQLRQYIVSQGHKMRVYVPYGEKWFNYSTRRLKENPKMAQEIIKALFVRG